MSDQPTIAVLGTGIMGSAMARNLAGAGFPVQVWNRNRDKAAPLADIGARVAGSPAEAVTGADIVITMLFDEHAVAETMAQTRSGLSAEVIWVQQSTVGYEGAARLARLARDLEVRYVDAPVLGTRKPAEEGALVVLAAGAGDVRSRLEPVFDAIGSRTIWLDSVGDGSKLKLAVNAWVVVVVEGIAESLRLTSGLGLDPQLFLDAVAGGAMDAPYVQLKGKTMLAGDFTPQFPLVGAAKDADFIVAAAQAHGLDLAVIEAARNHLARAVAAGHGDDDLSVTYAEH